MKKVIYLLISLLTAFTGHSQIRTTFNFDEQAGVGQYKKAEIGIMLPPTIAEQVSEFISDSRIGINPYDPEQIDVTSTWTSPSGKTQKVNGFFYQNFRAKNDKSWTPVPTEFNWLLRWSPDEIGSWSVIVKVITKEGSQKSSELNFECVSSDRDGYLTVNPFKPNGEKFLYLNDSDEPFFAVGHNIAHGGHKKLSPKNANDHRAYIKEQGENGGNFWRLELGMHTYLPSGYDCTNYTNRLAGMNELDRIIEVSDELNMHFIAFRHHVEVQDMPSWSAVSWELNGYRSSLNLKDRLDYFSQLDAIRWQNNELRYILARWGYSTGFNFYGYSEIEGWIGDLKREQEIDDLAAMRVLTEWFSNQRSFVENELQMSRMLYANSFSKSSISNSVRKLPIKIRGYYDIFAFSDIIPYHTYGIGKETNLETRQEYSDFFEKHWNKPTIIEEVGLTLPHLYCATDEDFFKTIWTSSFRGEFGTAMHYWWDRGIHHNDMHKLYEPLSAFMAKIDLKLNFSPEASFEGSVKQSNIAYNSLVFYEDNLVYGFLFDPSYYWRNLRQENKKMEELFSQGRVSQPCMMKDGHELGVPLSNETFNITPERYEDAYTRKADKTPLTAQNYETNSIKIKGLKRTGLFGKKRSYKIEYYDPRDPNLKVVKSETVAAKRNGSLKLTIDESNWPASAFKISLVQ